MNEELSNGYLESTARAIDAECLACHNAPTKKDGKSSRRLIHTMLTTIGNQWDERGAQGTVFADALKKGCTACLADGRSRARLYSLTCGIVTRLPEHLNVSRPNKQTR